MIVVENDIVVSGMLNDELERCEEALAAINRALSELPRGSLGVRKKIYKNKVYEYHYLKFRKGNRVVNQHVAGNALKELQDKLALREKYLQESKSHEKRILYLKKLLKDKGHRGGDQEIR